MTLVGLLLLGFLSVSGLTLAQDLSSVVEKVAPSVVKITAISNGRRIATGSGFLVDVNGVIVTNHHVVRGASSFVIETADGNELQGAVVVAFDPIQDIALLRILVNVPSNPHLALSSHAAKPGGRVIVVGSPLGLEQSVSDGIVSAIRPQANGTELIQITAPISPGSSGSPVVDSSGDVIGIATFTLTAGENVNFAISTKHVRALLENHGLLREQASASGSASKLPEISSQGLFEAMKAKVRENPDDSNAHAEMGFAYWKLHKLSEALEEYKLAISLDPTNARALARLAALYIENKQRAEATLVYNLLIEAKPNYVAAYVMQAQSYEAMGQYDQAVSFYTKAIALDSRADDAYYRLGLIFRNHDKSAVREKELYTGAVERDPEYDYPRYLLGTMYLHLKDKASALAEFKRLKQRNSFLADSLFNQIYQ
jgi:cytochrome c-type biogenesis protein CcmH/NrfG